MIEEALILAAGKGTRMWPLTEYNPKPLLPLCGKSIIEQQIFSLKNIFPKKTELSCPTDLLIDSIIGT